MISVLENISLAELTTFKIGGNAKYFVDVKNQDDIKEAVLWAKQRSMPFYIIAGGSNVLVPDEGLEGLVIYINNGSYKIENGLLVVDPGFNLTSLIKSVSKLGLGGWEKLAGIPGTIGGAVRGNAGAFGVEIKDFVKSIRALNINNIEIRSFDYDECNFLYRESFFKNNTEWVIVEVSLILNEIDTDTLDTLIQETINEREKRHLQNVKAAGSFFMNPVVSTEVVDLFEKEKDLKSKGGRVLAGWLIEKVGMKGMSLGGAIASPMHPNYIVNSGNATAEDIKRLSDLIKNKVKNEFGVELKEEAMIFKNKKAEN